MANRAFLFSSTVHSADPSMFNDWNPDKGKLFVEVADSANMIPLSWLCCFSSEDLLSYEHATEYWTEAGTEIVKTTVLLPCVEKYHALNRLVSAREIFETIGGDMAVGQAYWNHAVTQMNLVPYKFLTINPMDILLESTDSAQLFVDSLACSSTKMRSLCALCGGQPDVSAYPLEDFMLRPYELPRDQRLRNSAALYTHINPRA